MDWKQIKTKLLEKNFRIFKDKHQDNLINKWYRYVEKDNPKADNILMEWYLAESIFWKDFWDNITEYWPWISWHDEQGIDFIFIEDKTLFIINSKNWKSSSFSNTEIEKIFLWLKTCYWEWTTENLILKKFIENNNFSTILKIKIYYFCKEWDKSDIKKTLISKSIAQIKAYSQPNKCTWGKFIWTEVILVNYEDVYLNDKKISISVDRDNEYLFSVDSETIYIARVPCKSIKEVVAKYWKDIFEKNIREEVGWKINSEIKKSLIDEPQNIFILNNGITIIGDSVNNNPNTNKIDVFNAQIINWQQSSWTISSIDKFSDDAYILCRFIQMDDPKKIRKITKTTNNQNPIDYRDFVSNDEVQEAIWEYFFQKSIYYERKASRKKEKWFSEYISNSELAQSTLAIILWFPSKITTPNKEKLFTDNLTNNWEKKWFYLDIFSQDIECMYDVWKNIYSICYNNSKSENELQAKGWLHIWRIWYKLKFKDYDQAFNIFQVFSEKFSIEEDMKSGKNPLSRIQTDIDLEVFLSLYKK